MKEEQFPVTITEKGVSAIIRKTEKKKDGEKHTYYIIEYILNGERKQVWRSDLDDAKDVARNACTKIGNGDRGGFELNDRQRFTYLRATELLGNLQIPLDTVAHEYANALKTLPPGVSIRDAVDFYCHRNTKQLEKRSVRQVADEMLVVKRTAKLSEVHLKDLECRLGRFANDFNKSDITDVSGELLQAWLDGLNVSGRTTKNYFRAVAALFRFAIRRKYLPKDALDELDAVQQPKVENGEQEIFTSDEMREILSEARREMVPWLAIAGFAGLRSAEIARLDWSEVKLEERFIKIMACKGKTGGRLAPVTNDLAKWLAPYVKESGPVAAFDSWWNQIAQVEESVNEKRHEIGVEKSFKWKHNGLRHSFCSYRLAAIKNAAQVALEAGNSAQMIFKHYRQVVTESEAAKWFSILPPGKPQGRKLAL